MIHSGDTLTHINLIQEFRLQLDQSISNTLSDHDCLRYLRGRRGNVELAVDMCLRCFEWRQTLLDPFPGTNLQFSPNIILAHPRKLDEHPKSSLIPATHSGFGKEGHPIYWEKTGYVQSIFDEVRQHFSNIELIQYHVICNEIFEHRLEYASKKFNRPVSKTIVVFDMTGIQISLDLDSIWYIKQVIDVDQK
jgi:hypothetical protein